jgi:superfamily II DNA/RNA helicase
MRVEVARAASTVATTTQRLVKTGREAHDKRDTLRRLIRSAEGLKNAIIFCNRKREVAQLHRSLVRHGFSVLALHGDMDQPSRTAALESFRRGEVTLLVASDVAARGLDIPDVSHVFNFDVPHHPDDYVHRIGRTGRAGRTGTAITIVAPADGKAVAAIEKLIGQSIPWMGEPAGGESPAPSEGHREPRGRRPARHAPRREHSQASVTRLDEARPLRERKPAERKPAERERHESVHAEEPASAHLPAFLLRPVRLKA